MPSREAKGLSGAATALLRRGGFALNDAGLGPSTLSLKPRNALAHPSPPSRYHRHPGFNAVKFSSPSPCKISILNNSTSVPGVHKYNACQGDNLVLRRLIATYYFFEEKREDEFFHGYSILSFRIRLRRRRCRSREIYTRIFSIPFRFVFIIGDRYYDRSWIFDEEISIDS